MRSARWITVLVCLFTFQSLWNVAAAFCIHEDKQINSASFHFGHHQTVICSTEKNGSTHDASDSQTEANQVNDTSRLMLDHDDHLPSMSHVILSIPQTLVQSNVSETFYPDHFLWSNAYQSPHIGQIPPPPELSPLLVG